MKAYFKGRLLVIDLFLYCRHFIDAFFLENTCLKLHFCTGIDLTPKTLWNNKIPAIVYSCSIAGWAVAYLMKKMKYQQGTFFDLKPASSAGSCYPGSWARDDLNSRFIMGGHSLPAATGIVSESMEKQIFLAAGTS
ncbi:hypothetical protein [Niabella beijingensis]|uniref:hypothetical protein n=1 Tax=Niabella beijingensis TaxID=2872700 RepID=UPI001CC1B33C|nr:hypothetical protein [Niabella beijingensis]MBZ4192184.1 hypothetical protein [Niabella beijingensis]